MPGARRSLASPVVSGVLCPCGSPHGSAVESGGSSSSGGGGGNAGSCGRSLCEASEQDRRLRTLFQKLDVNRDGALCVHDLAVGLGRLGLHRSELDLLQSFFAWRERHGGTVLWEPELAAEGSPAWMLLNNPVFLLKPLSVSIVPLPFPSSDSFSTSIE